MYVHTLQTEPEIEDWKCRLLRIQGIDIGLYVGDIRHPTSDISYSDIGPKHVGLNSFIPISEEFRYRHQLPFRYQTKSISDIPPLSKMDKFFPNDPSKIVWHIIFPTGFDPTVYMSSIVSGVLPLRYTYKCCCRILDIGQKFIPISDIMSDSALFSPISDVLISGSVQYRWSRISDWVPTYGPRD